MKKLVKKIKDTSKGIFSSRKGFTLLELLIVVLIIGILAGIALPQYQRAKEKTIMTEGIKLAKQIAEANQRYYLLYGEYANDIRDLDIEFAGEIELLGDTYRITTNNFILSSSNLQRTFKALAQRKPFNEIYYLYMTFESNVIQCRSIRTSRVQKELCDELNIEGHF